VTFTDPVFVSANDGINSVAAAVDAEGDGTVAMVWQDADFSTGANSIGFSHSMDHGATFSAPAVVSAPPAYAGCAQVLWSTNDVLTLWTSEEAGSERIFAARTVDHGASFTTPIGVDQNPAKSWCSTVVRGSGGVVYAIWEEGDAFINTKIDFARSTDRGVSFSAPLTVSVPSQIATCPSIAVGDGRVVVTWTNQVNNALADSYITASTDGGATFSAPLQIPSSAGRCHQVIAHDATHVGLVWHEPPAVGAQSDIYFGRAELSIP
jgi:hypothetical protein